MLSAIRRWRPRHLVSAWLAYWTLLLVAVLGPPVATVIGITKDKGTELGAHVSFATEAVKATLTHNGATAWSLSASTLEIAFWLVAPPLALWVIWLRAQRREERTDAAGARGSSAAAASAAPPELPQGMPAGLGDRPGAARPVGDRSPIPPARG